MRLKFKATRYIKSYVSPIVKAWCDGQIVEVPDVIGTILLLWYPDNWEKVPGRGSSQFNSISGRAITHNLGHTNYRVSIFPTQNPQGYLGEIWLNKEPNRIIVYNSGPATTSFEYMIELIS